MERTVETGLDRYIGVGLGGHIAQMARVMAKVNRNEVGAWTQYHSVLNDRESSR